MAMGARPPARQGWVGRRQDRKRIGGIGGGWEPTLASAKFPAIPRAVV